MRTAVCLLALFPLAGCGQSSDPRLDRPATHVVPALPPDNASTPESRARERVTQWLDGAKKGQGETNWRTPTNGEVFGPPLRPHAVRSYEILSAKTRPAEGSVAQFDGMKHTTIVVVRVDSSDPNGRPVTRDYRVAVGDDGVGAVLMGAR